MIFHLGNYRKITDRNYTETEGETAYTGCLKIKLSPKTSTSINEEEKCFREKICSFLIIDFRENREELSFLLVCQSTYTLSKFRHLEQPVFETSALLNSKGLFFFKVVCRLPAIFRSAEPIRIWENPRIRDSRYLFVECLHVLRVSRGCFMDPRPGRM